MYKRRKRKPQHRNRLLFFFLKHSFFICLEFYAFLCWNTCFCCCWVFITKKKHTHNINEEEGWDFSTYFISYIKSSWILLRNFLCFFFFLMFLKFPKFTFVWNSIAGSNFNHHKSYVICSHSWHSLHLIWMNFLSCDLFSKFSSSTPFFPFNGLSL